MGAVISEDVWQRRATAVAIEAARNVVRIGGGAIPPSTPVGRLGDTEWAWIVAAILFAWIRTRAEQATAEQIDTEQAIRLTGLDPNPWDAGAVVAILPDLVETIDLDWTRPVAEWPRELMVEFLTKALALIRKALAARDLGSGITRRSSADAIAREGNAAAGGPLMTPDELNDQIPL